MTTWNPTDEVIDRAVALDGLTPHARNYKAHPADQIDRLVASLQAFGQPRTIAVWRGTILAGHGLTQAARALGWRQIRASIVPDAWSEARAQAYLVADNETQRGAEPDSAALAALIDEARQEVDLSALGFDSAALDALLAEVGGDLGPPEPGAGGDEYEDQGGPTRCQPGDLWELGNHRVLCGDSTDSSVVAQLMDGARAAVVFTDPPYNIDYGSIKHPKFRQRHIQNDNMSTSNWRGFCELVADAIDQVTDGCVYVCHAPGPDGRVCATVMDERFHCSTTIIWNKDVFTLGRGKYQNKYEPIWFGWVKDGTNFTDDRTLTNVWDIDRPKASEEHPTMKPVELVVRAIEHSTSRADIVVDFFLGSGTTLIAAERTGRRCYGTEIESRYVDVILRRWETETGQEARRISGADTQGDPS